MQKCIMCATMYVHICVHEGHVCVRTRIDRLLVGREPYALEVSVQQYFSGTPRAALPWVNTECLQGEQGDMCLTRGPARRAEEGFGTTGFGVRRLGRKSPRGVRWEAWGRAGQGRADWSR